MTSATRASLAVRLTLGVAATALVSLLSLLVVGVGSARMVEDASITEPGPTVHLSSPP